METISITLPPPTINRKVQEAREKLIGDIQKALQKELDIRKADSQDKNSVQYFIQRYLGIGKHIQTEGRPLLDRFVKGVDVAYKNQFNIDVLNAMKKQLERAEEANSQRDSTGSTRTHYRLDILHRNSVICPKNTIPKDQVKLYQWEVKSDGQLWCPIEEKFDVALGMCQGFVRLVYNGALHSNVIDVRTVINRQAHSAKRKQYRFRRTNRDFQQRCYIVAQRILGLTTPHINQAGLSPGLSMRVFQDRVSQLPARLDMDIPSILTLCKHTLSKKGDSEQDSTFVHMIELCEPTIHINPAALHRKLKQIYSGQKITLNLTTDDGVQQDSDDGVQRDSDTDDTSSYSDDSDDSDDSDSASDNDANDANNANNGNDDGGGSGAGTENPMNFDLDSGNDSDDDANNNGGGGSDDSDSASANDANNANNDGGGSGAGTENPMNFDLDSGNDSDDDANNNGGGGSDGSDSTSANDDGGGSGAGTENPMNFDLDSGTDSDSSQDGYPREPGDNDDFVDGVEYEITEQELEELKENFQKYDTSNNGKITLGQFQQLTDLKDDEIQTMIINGDINANETISLDEYQKWYIKLVVSDDNGRSDDADPVVGFVVDDKNVANLKPFEILGIPRDCKDGQTIKEAYLNVAERTISSGGSEAKEAIKYINDAYEFMMNDNPDGVVDEDDSFDGRDEMAFYKAVLDGDETDDDVDDKNLANLKPFEILGIPRDCKDEQTIKEAYFKVAREWDVLAEGTEAKEAIKYINDAYEFMMNDNPDGVVDEDDSFDDRDEMAFYKAMLATTDLVAGGSGGDSGENLATEDDSGALVGANAIQTGRASQGSTDRVRNLASLTPFEILGIPRDCKDVQTIKEAYFKVAREWDVLAEGTEEIEAIKYINDAYEFMMNDNPDGDVDEPFDERDEMAFYKDMLATQDLVAGGSGGDVSSDNDDSPNKKDENEQVFWKGGSKPKEGLIVSINGLIGPVKFNNGGYYRVYRDNGTYETVQGWPKIDVVKQSYHPSINANSIRSGELAAMLSTMSDWATSDDELNFAEDSDHEFEVEGFAETSSGHDTTGLAFAETSSGNDASEMLFAESSDKMSSALEFAESSDFAMTSDSDMGQ